MAIGLDPKYTIAYNNRGYAKLFLEQYESALEDFNFAIKLKPNSALIYYNRGKVNIYLHRFQQAKSDYEVALKLAEDSGNLDLKSMIEKRMLIDGIYKQDSKE